MGVHSGHTAFVSVFACVCAWVYLCVSVGFSLWFRLSPQSLSLSVLPLSLSLRARQGVNSLESEVVKLWEMFLGTTFDQSMLSIKQVSIKALGSRLLVCNPLSSLSCLQGASACLLPCTEFSACHPRNSHSHSFALCQDKLHLLWDSLSPSPTTSLARSGCLWCRAPLRGARGGGGVTWPAP